MLKKGRCRISLNEGRSPICGIATDLKHVKHLCRTELTVSLPFYGQYRFPNEAETDCDPACKSLTCSTCIVFLDNVCFEGKRIGCFVSKCKLECHAFVHLLSNQVIRVNERV